MRRLEHLVHRRNESDRELTQARTQRGQHFPLEGITLRALHDLPESLWGILESLQHDVLEPLPRELSDSPERLLVENDVSHNRKRWVTFQELRDRRHIHHAVSRGIDDQGRQRLVPDDGVELLPGACRYEIRAVNEDMPHVRQEPLGQKDDDAHDGAWNGIPENLGIRPRQREQNLIENRTFDTKPALREAKSTYSYRLNALAWTVQPFPLPPEEPSMPRKNLLTLAALITALALTACADVTAPKLVCPITGGSDTCKS